MSGRSRSLAARLAKAEKFHHSSAVTARRVALNRCIQELDRGDTERASDHGWELLKLTEASGDYEITSDVIGWCHLLLDTMRHRPSWNAYSSKRIYVSHKSRCVTTDRDFVASLNQSQFQCNPQVVKKLLELHTDFRSADVATETMQQRKNSMRLWWTWQTKVAILLVRLSILHTISVIAAMDPNRCRGEIQVMQRLPTALSLVDSLLNC